MVFGTCEPYNLSEIGLLRCATFGEGNYFGAYLGFISILFYNSRNILQILPIGLLISFSPPSTLIYLYVLMKKFRYESFVCMGVVCVAFVLIILYLLCDYNISEFFFPNGVSQTSSTGERLEFIAASVRMFLDYPIAGVGIGQFGMNLDKYTDFSHFLNNIFLDDKRYIANSNIFELLSELGVFGLLFYMYILFNLKAIGSPGLTKIEVVILVIFNGVFNPTIFSVINGLMIGILSNKNLLLLMNKDRRYELQQLH